MFFEQGYKCFNTNTLPLSIQNFSGVPHSNEIISKLFVINIPDSIIKRIVQKSLVNINLYLL